MTVSSPVFGTFDLNEGQRIWLMRRAFQSAPEEACGFITDTGKFLEIPNTSKYPYRSFEMSAQNLSSINPSSIVALWHTHPGGSIRPSVEDQHNMSALYGAYGNWAYIIATKSDVALYWLAPNSDFWSGFVK